jgi:hypothetical protein
MVPLFTRRFAEDSAKIVHVASLASDFVTELHTSNLPSTK